MGSSILNDSAATALERVLHKLSITESTKQQRKGILKQPTEKFERLNAVQRFLRKKKVAKGVNFNETIDYCPSKETPYIGIESYDDRLVSVASFSSTDVRSNTRKILDFLTRSAIHAGHAPREKILLRQGYHEKMKLTASDVLKWRRLAVHDWTLEESLTERSIKSKKSEFYYSIFKSYEGRIFRSLKKFFQH